MITEKTYIKRTLKAKTIAFNDTSFYFDLQEILTILFFILNVAYMKK